MVEVMAALIANKDIGITPFMAANLRAEIRLEFTALMRGDDTRAICLAFLMKRQMRG